MITIAFAVTFALLLVGPMAVEAIERNLELYCLLLGVAGATLAARWDGALLVDALRAPAPITIAVVVAGLGFARLRPRLEQGFARLRRNLSRPLLSAATTILLGLASSLITAIVAALVLVEAVRMLQLGPPARNRVAVAGCFAIGFGSALTPAGEPLSAIVVHGLGLGFFDLFFTLGDRLIPGVVASGLLAAWFARGEYDLIAEAQPVRERASDALLQGTKTFAFVAGLTLIGAAYGPLAAHWISRFGPYPLFWANTVSAVLDNATLAALEVHGLPPADLRPVVLSMLISGGMLIPGNIPNIVCAGLLKIRSTEWARIGIPIGLGMLGICFAVLILGGG